VCLVIWGERGIRPAAIRRGGGGRRGSGERDRGTRAPGGGARRMDDEVTGSGRGVGQKMAPGEVELKEKAGTAWSHSYLNQKPWHPLSYPNQRRKWIAEQTHANRARRQEEVQREFAQEQEFFRQTALFSKKDKEKVLYNQLLLSISKTICFS
jgi:hypothetical protein